MSYLGDFARGATAGYIAGSFAVDPRRTARKLVAAAFAAFASIVMLLATIVPLMNSDDSDRGFVRAFAPVGFACVLIIVIAGAKFMTAAPFSVFRLPVHIIASFRTSIVTIILWSALLILAILTFLVVLNPG